MVSTKAMTIAVLVLRLITLKCLIGSVIVILNNNYTLSDGGVWLYQLIHAYRYVLATALIGLAYTMLQIPFSIYRVCSEKSPTHDGISVSFDFYADKVIALLLATGVGAGFAVSIESKRLINWMNEIFLLSRSNIDGWYPVLQDYFDIGIRASIILLFGFVSMAFVSILTSIKFSGRQGFFFR